MSSHTGEWCCSECESENAYQESFNDEETGHIMGCFNCGYYDVYREDSETGEESHCFYGMVVLVNTKYIAVPMVVILLVVHLYLLEYGIME